MDFDQCIEKLILRLKQTLYLLLDENGRRLSERSNRHSGSISGQLSKSKSKLSRNSNSRNSSSRNSTSRNNSLRNSNSRYSIENFEHIGSPRVKLNDVSKLLQNSHTINIRMVCVINKFIFLIKTYFYINLYFNCCIYS